MFNKNFEYFTKQQKSALCHSVKSFVKKNFENLNCLTESIGYQEFSDVEELQNFHIQKNNLYEKFLENEQYYLNIGVSRLYFIKEYLDNENFIRELKFYFDECLKYYEYQRKLEPLKQAQKIFAREQRQKAKEFQMSKEAPTKRQLSYYKNLCKKYNKEPIILENASKLDLKNAIKEIKETLEIGNEYKTD